MLQHVTRWATLAFALTLAVPAFAQSKDDASAPPRSAPAEAGVLFHTPAKKASPAPGFIMAPRTAAPHWSVEAFRGGDPDLFFEDFNDTTPGAGVVPEDWAQFETGLGTTSAWGTRDRTVGGVSERVAYSAFQNVEDGSFAISWMVTPEVTVGGANTLTFQAAEVFTPEYNSQYDVLVSTTSQTDASSFTVVATYNEEDLPDDNDGLGEFTVDLSAYAGQAVYVAFRHTQDDGDGWIIDDVSITIGGGGTGGTPGLAEDFESVVAGGAGSELPEGWIQFDANGSPDGASNWGIYFETNTDPDTNNVAGSFFQAGDQQDFLVSPLAGVQEGDFLIFDATQIFSAPFGSVLEVRVSTTSQTDPATFTTIASYTEDDIALFPTLGSLAVDLSAYGGQDVYIAWVHLQNDGDNLAIDNVRTVVPAEVSVESVSAAVQFTGNGSPGDDPIAILGGDIAVAGEDGTLEVTELTFTTAGTDDVDDIDQALVAYTGGTPTGDPIFFGDAVDNPDGTFTVTGSQEISSGSNFFVVYYVVNDAPDASRLLDATFENATIDGVNVVADPTTLDGAVTLVAPPDNDDFEDAIELSGLSGTVNGSNVGATAQDGEAAPSCQTTATDVSVFWSFTAPEDASGSLTVDLSGSSYDTVLSFHSPDDLSELACDDDGGEGLDSRIEDFPLDNGQTILIRVSGFQNQTGDIVLAYELGNLVAGEEDAAAAFGLSAFRPNPTAGRTAVTLGVDQAQQVTVEVVDLLGRRVVTLHQGELAAGEVTLTVPAGTLAPGTYVVRALGETVQSMQRLTVTR